MMDMRNQYNEQTKSKNKKQKKKKHLHTKCINTNNTYLLSYLFLILQNTKIVTPLLAQLLYSLLRTTRFGKLSAGQI